MKIGLYSITYLGIWYKGDAIPLKDLMRFAKEEGWEGIEFDTKRPHAAPMDLSEDDRKELRDLAGELDLPISAVSPNCDLSSPVPEHREAMICYVRECIKLARDLGSPICKIFAAWRGVATRDGLGSYEYTRNDPFPEWVDDRWWFVVDSLQELSKFAEDQGIILALQNHGPVVRNYRDVLALIEEVDSPAFKACMDIPCEGRKAGSPEWARKIVRETGDLMVHSHYNGEFMRDTDGRIKLVSEPEVAYDAFVDALIESNYNGFMNWEFCHPAMEGGQPAGIDYVHKHTRLALEFMKQLRDDAQLRLQEKA
ncbi:MAG TPA: sugar phosphate isomerase/epimerase family protein [Candidatus Atribacteria bacterium]|nr:sugar phosphate isomerase/epimerase family protein [Candidatus Atribacteria bacterium]